MKGPQILVMMVTVMLICMTVTSAQPTQQSTVPSLVSAMPDSGYVTPAELEKGFTLFGDDLDPNPLPKRRIYPPIAVSPDGQWLAYAEEHPNFVDYMKVRDLYAGRTTIIGDNFQVPYWSPDSRLLWLSRNPDNDLTFFEPATRQWRHFNGPGDTAFHANGWSWAPDGNLYFPISTVYGWKTDSTLWRLLLDSSFRSGRYVNQYVGQDQGVPLFPPDTIAYYVNGIYDNQANVVGINIISNFNYEGRRTFMLPVPDTSWIISRSNSWGASEWDPNIVVGPKGDLYIYRSFRSKQERDRKDWSHFIPIDSVDWAAHNACGWYHIDTVGGGMQQLVRCLSSNLGATITRDGQHIFYTMLMPDSTCAIWEMDRFGRNKHQVTHSQEGEFLSAAPLQHMVRDCRMQADCRMLNQSHASLHVNLMHQSAITVSIVDLLGRVVVIPLQQLGIESGSHELPLDVSGLPPGAYFVIVQGGGEQVACRMLRD